MKFTPPEGALAVTIDAIPDASTLAPGARVFVLPDDTRARGFLGAFGRRPARSARCNALLVAGYVDIRADAKTDVVSATAPAR